MEEKKSQLSLNEVMEGLERIINNNTKHIEGVGDIYQYEISDKNRIFQLSIEDNVAKVTESVENIADCVLILSMDNFLQLMLGELSGIKAIMTGKLKVKGDLSKAIKMEELLKKYNLSEQFE